MRGISTIKTMRMCGLAPSHVSVSVFPVKSWVLELTNQQSRHMEVVIEPSDIAGIETADLRPLVGLHVFVTGPECSDTERVAKACHKAGARIVEAFFFDPDRPYADFVRGMRMAGDDVRTVWPQ